MVAKGAKTKSTAKPDTRSKPTKPTKPTTKSTKTSSTKREPTPAAVLKKVATISDSNKALQKEIKSMTKIFGENQKVLVAMKGMIDTLVSTLEEIQKQSRQINNIEIDTQKMYSDLNHVKSQSNMVAKLNNQTTKLQSDLQKIAEEQRAIKSSKLVSRVEESTNSIKNNSQMIIKVGQYVDEIRDNLRTVTKKTDQVLETKSDLDNLRSSINDIVSKTSKMDATSQVVESLRQELGDIASKITAHDNLVSDLSAIKVMIDLLASKSSKIDSIGLVVDSLKQEFATISSDAISAKNQNSSAIDELGTKIDKIESDISTVSSTLKKQDESVAEFHNVSNQLKQEFATISSDAISAKNQNSSAIDELGTKIDKIESDISTVSSTLKKQDESVAEFHNVSNQLKEDIKILHNVTSKSSDASSKEMMALLRLAEYQSSMRMNGESKYGDVSDLENMAKQTYAIATLFDKVSVESDQQLPLPDEVQRWAVSKILDCADKWDVRFSDVYNVLVNTLGRDMLKTLVRPSQIRDIYGIRALDELRQDLNIS